MDNVSGEAPHQWDRLVGASTPAQRHWGVCGLTRRVNVFQPSLVGASAERAASELELIVKRRLVTPLLVC